MPDDIDIIARLKTVDDGFIAGLDNASASLQKLKDNQEKANKALSDSEERLKNQSKNLQQAKKDLDEAAGSDERYYKQQEQIYKKAVEENQKLTAEVEAKKAAYEEAKKAAEELAATEAKAAATQQTAGGGRIVPLPLPVQQLPLIPQITDVLNNVDLSGFPQQLLDAQKGFDKLREAVLLAKNELQGLDQSGAEFQQLTDFVNSSEQAIKAYDNALLAAGGSSEVLADKLSQAQAQLQKINQTDVSELPVVIAQSKSGFDDLSASVQIAKQRLDTLDSNSEEFKNLANVISQADGTLKQYSTTIKGTAESHASLRQQILTATNALAQMVEAGKENTKEYAEMEKHVAHLTNLYDEQRKRLKVLSSETRSLDFGKAAIQSAIAGFEVYTSVSILAGGASEELQHKTLQLFAAMQLLNSIEELTKQTKRGSTIATNLQSAAQATYTAVIGASTGALRVFRTALLATGIGAAVAAIAFIVIKLREHAKATEEAARQQKIFNEVNESAIKSYTAEVVHLGLIKDKLTDLSIPQKDRVKLAKEYNKTAEEGNKIDLKQIDNIALVNAAIDTQIEKIKERAFARAAESVLVQRYEVLFLAQEKARTKALTDFNAAAGQTFDPKGFEKQEVFAERRAKEITQGLFAQTAEGIKNDPNVKKAQEEVDKALQAIGSKINIGDLITPDKTKTETSTKAVENIFEQEFLRLTSQLSELRTKETITIRKINKEFSDKLAVEKAKIEKEIKDKKLTGSITDKTSQAGILFTLETAINTEQLNKALADYNKKVLAERQKLNDDLKALQDKANLDDVNNIQVEFTRRAAVIDFNEKKALDDQGKVQEEAVKKLNEAKKSGAIKNDQEYYDALSVIVNAGEQEQTAIIEKYSIERQNLSADIFQKTLVKINSVFEESSTGLNEATARRILDEKALFDAGTINFQTYQKNITRILKEEKDKQRQIELDKVNADIAAIEKRLQKEIDVNEREKLIDQERQLRNQRANLLSTVDQIDPNAEARKAAEQTIAYAEAIGQLTDSIIGFWQKANEAESKALDRSISLQEKRVEAAQRIAARGNAQYLKEEEDRLTELNVKRENAARKQLGIDAALQASQILVGITGAISRIATSPFGVETIADIAIIVASLAAGYGIVKSLQGNQPKLAEGTTELKRGRHPAGRDTIPAWLDEGEAVIPTAKNKKYKKAVEAIYHGKVPAEDMNAFVVNYKKKPQKSTDFVEKTFEETKSNSTIYKQFINNVNKVPLNVINSFIENYQEKRFFKGTPDLMGKAGIDQIPIMATRGEAIIPADKNISYKPVVEAIFSGFPAEHLNNFVNNYHSIKSIPQPNYERIKNAAEMHISSDGKLATIINEQNKLIVENNDLQRATLRAMKAMAVSVNMDENGIAIAVNEHMEKIKIDKRT